MTASKPVPPGTPPPSPPPPGPTGPTTTGPQSYGHPIPGPRGKSAATLVHPHAAGAGLPRLGEVVRDAERYLRQALAVLEREVDPQSLPPEDDSLHLPAYVHVRRMSAKADVRSALKMLGDIADAPLPAVGSAVHPGRGFALPAAVGAPAFASTEGMPPTFPGSPPSPPPPPSPS